MWLNTPSLFIRKLQMQLLMAGLLTYSLFAGLPFTVASQGQKVLFRAYSSGNCSGFSPDSLLALSTKNHKRDANVCDRFLKAKKYHINYVVFKHYLKSHQFDILMALSVYHFIQLLF